MDWGMKKNQIVTRGHNDPDRNNMKRGRFWRQKCPLTCEIVCLLRTTTRNRKPAKPAALICEKNKKRPLLLSH